jgi:hypothetical protein
MASVLKSMPFRLYFSLYFLLFAPTFDDEPSLSFKTKKLPFGRLFVLIGAGNGIGFAAPALIGFADRHTLVCLSLVVGPTSS